MNTFQEIPVNNSALNKRKTIHNKGINDANYLINPRIHGKHLMCPYYKVWTSMLTRCYSEAYHKTHPTYLGCSVYEEWLTFSNFKSWMEKQNWKNKELDKDLIIRGNKVYSPSTCIFVTSAINNLLSDRLSLRGACVIGVQWCKSHKKYKAVCSVNSKLKFLGRYVSEKEASQAYLTFKKQHIIFIAHNQTDLQLKQILLNIANTEY